MIRLDGKSLAEQIKDNIRDGVGLLPRPVVLAVIMIGDNTASDIYVRNKQADCKSVGIQSVTYRFPNSATQMHVLEKIDELNANPQVDGIIVQMPIPSHLNKEEIINRIDPTKDVDGFQIQQSKLMEAFRINNHIPETELVLTPCTPTGIIRLLDHYDISLESKVVTMVGRSEIVGLPMCTICNARNATVINCHSKTTPDQLNSALYLSDVVIVATGVPKLVKAHSLKPGVVVVDVGMNRIDGKLCGDVDYYPASLVASHITPVPGGVGPMTRAILLENTLNAAKYHIGKSSTEL